METKTSAKDFFLHLGAMVTLYATAVSFLNLLFRVINKAFPEVTKNIYAWGGGSEISLPVATLIVAFPLFILLSYFVQKIYTENPMKKELGIRKWLTYITLFVAGIALAGDLIFVIYKFLDGQDLTAAFILKVLAVLLVAGLVFIYYLQDIRDKISSKSRKILLLATSVLLLAVIIWGFAVLGSPKTQRLKKADVQKIMDLQEIQWQVISYWQMNGALPTDLKELEKDQRFLVPTDKELKKEYEYRGTGEMTFELCADFSAEDMSNRNTAPAVYMKGDVIQNSNWNHKAGRQCFKRIIDPVVYPTQVKG